MDDYDAAIAFYVDRLGFRLIEATHLAGDKRWVLVAPPGGRGARLLLAKASGPEQQARVGNQTGGRVFLFLETDDCRRDFETLKAQGVEFVGPPGQAAFGVAAVFKDLYGNLWDLVQPAPAALRKTS